MSTIKSIGTGFSNTSIIDEKVPERGGVKKQLRILPVLTFAR